jgi:hypothetical protein
MLLAGRGRGGVSGARGGAARRAGTRRRIARAPRRARCFGSLAHAAGGSDGDRAPRSACRPRRLGAARRSCLALIRDGHGPRAFDTLLRYRSAVQAEFWRALRALSAFKAEAPVPIERAGAVLPSHARRSRPAEACTYRRLPVCKRTRAGMQSKRIRATPQSSPGLRAPEPQRTRAMLESARGPGAGIQTNPKRAGIGGEGADGARQNRKSGVMLRPRTG